MPYSLPIAFLQMDADPGCLTAFSPIGSKAAAKAPLTSSSLQVYTFALVFAAMVLVVASEGVLLLIHCLLLHFRFTDYAPAGVGFRVLTPVT